MARRSDSPIQAFVSSSSSRAFGDNGLASSICADNFGPALQTIGEKLGVFLEPSCITGSVAKRPGTSTPDCTVTQSSPDGTGKTVQAPIPACDADSDSPPCWSLASAAGTRCPAGSQVVRINRGGQVAPDNTRNTVECSVCVAGHSDPSRGCP